MGTQKKVLIIDDEPDTITFLSTWLQDQGYQTCAAVDGEQGMEAILREKPDLVLLDLNMPNQTGYQLYREIRLCESFKQLPVIFITGMSEVNIFSSECERLPEPVACIDKPIDLQVLQVTIKQIIG